MIPRDDIGKKCNSGCFCFYMFRKELLRNKDVCRSAPSRSFWGMSSEGIFRNASHLPSSLQKNAHG